VGSGFLNVEWGEVDPYVKLTIPGAANAVYQIVGNPDVEGRIRCRDYEGIYQLLYNTNIDGSANKAVTTTTRNVITYFTVTIDYENVVAATGDHVTGTNTFAFSQTRIGRIYKEFSDPASPWVVEFYADLVTQS